MDTYNTIKPGQPLYDTEGKLIQVHGGSILHHNGIYYWYGENKEKYIAGGNNWHFGVKLYSSKDFYNWKDEGTILEPQDKIEDPMHPDRIMDRPHIVHNKRTNQFVMWVKFAGSQNDYSDWTVQYMGVAVADKITDKFEMLHYIRPLGMEMGDFDIWIDERDGKGYFIADRVHTEVVIADMTDDYLNITGNYSSHFPHEEPPAAREAPVFFKRSNKYYIISSGTTGYNPNPSEVAMADLMHGPYKVLGNPCLNDVRNTSFDCQFSSVFKHPTISGLYIAIGDRWMAKSSVLNGIAEAETSEATYIWLPIKFNGNIPYIEWRDEWKLEEYS
ncbi:MAG: family 43 glycosylhydrolase [Suipraeoptans sp.]